MQKILCFDISNVLYRTFFANPNTDELTTAGLAHHQALTTLNKYFKQIQPVRVIMTFDRSNWRKMYTESEECISGKLYKGQRRKNMTPADQARYDKFKVHLTDFENIIRDYTNIPCLASDLLEADDLMAGVVNRFKDEYEVVLISADKDLMQLIHPNVKLIDPATNKERTLIEYDNDPAYFMYEKCFRGDSGDNVQSAYPRIRKTKIKAAYNDPFLHETIMNESWTNQDNKVMSVKALFDENKLLMDLNDQPEGIKELIDDTITDGLNNPGKFSQFYFLKFCKQYELERISESLDNYLPLLAG